MQWEMLQMSLWNYSTSFTGIVNYRKTRCSWNPGFLMWDFFFYNSVADHIRELPGTHIDLGHTSVAVRSAPLPGWALRIVWKDSEINSWTGTSKGEEITVVWNGKSTAPEKNNRQSAPTNGAWKIFSLLCKGFQLVARCWFWLFFILNPVLGRFPFSLILFKGVGSTTNQI